MTSSDDKTPQQLEDLVDALTEGFVGDNGASSSLGDSSSVMASTNVASRWKSKPYPVGKIPITIHRDGEWSYNGTLFTRPAMVSMLGKSLCFYEGNYFLEGPEQFLKISVEDCPFLALSFTVTPANPTATDQALPSTATSTEQQVHFELLTGEVVRLDASHPLSFSQLPNGERDAPQILVRQGLAARLSRSCYYRLIEAAEEKECNGVVGLYIRSCGEDHLLGPLDSS